METHGYGIPTVHEPGMSCPDDGTAGSSDLPYGEPAGHELGEEGVAGGGEAPRLCASAGRRRGQVGQRAA